MSFRETALSEIFRLAIQTLQQINEGTMHFGNLEDEFRLLRQVLHLCVNCLSFDFTGTMIDESNDDQPTVMIPYSWSILRETKIPELFFTFYKKCWMYGIVTLFDLKIAVQCITLAAWTLCVGENKERFFL